MDPNNNVQNTSTNGTVVVPQPSLAPSVLGNNISASPSPVQPMQQPASKSIEELMAEDSQMKPTDVQTPNSQPMDEGQSLSQMVGAENSEEKESPLKKLASKLTKFKDSLVEEVPETAVEQSTPAVTEPTPISPEQPMGEVPVSVVNSTNVTLDEIAPVNLEPTPSAPVLDPVMSTPSELSDATGISNNGEMTDVSSPTAELPTDNELASAIQNLSEVTPQDDSAVIEQSDEVVEDVSSLPEMPLIEPTDNLSSSAPVEDPLAAMLETSSTPANDTQNLGSASETNNSVDNGDLLASSISTPQFDSIVEDVKSLPSDEVLPAEPVAETPVEPVTTPVVEDSPSPVETPTPSPDGKYQYTIHQLLDIVFERGASDLHLSVGYPAFIRVDGTLQAVSKQLITDEIAEELILPVLPDNKKELLEVNREVDLAYAYKENARFRINAYYQQQSMAAAFRLIPNRIRTIDELMLPQIYHQLAKLRQGLVLVTGPTGSGKSSTLAAIIQEVNQSRAEHIITIEDPIEYVFPKAKALVDQRELHEDTHSWEIAMKSALRQDPDIVLVGEMRDYETISAAITLAETGHLVFATLHTNSAAQTIDRVIDVFPEHQQAQVRSQLSNTVEAVIAQRLIPLDGGGRRAVSEIMIATPAIRNLIREGKTHQIDNVIRTSADIGMFSIEKSLVDLVRDGKITMERAQEYAVHPEEVVRLLKG